MLRVESLTAGYGKFQVVFDVSLEAKEREILTIVGPNGSGKSTLLKSIAGITKIFSGRVIYKGQDVTAAPPHVKARMGLAFLPQTDNVFADLTVWENLRMAAYTLEEERGAKNIEKVMELYPLLKRKLNVKAKSLSGGERQILAMAMTLIREPEVIMLDEPTANLAPIMAKDILGKIRELRDSLGKTVVLVEQNARAALEMSDEAVLLVSGRVAYSGKAKKLLEDEDLSKRYLGLR